MEKLDKFKQHLAYPALLMAGIAFIVCSLLLLSHYLTKDLIKENKYEDLNRLLSQVLPISEYDNEPLKQPYYIATEDKELRFYRATLKDNVSAIILFTQSAGYSGDISLLIAIKADGALSGVRVLSHTETPGLGDKIELAKSDWILSFNDLSLDDPKPLGWAVKKDGGEFDAFTGATITPRAVVKGVFTTLQLFAKEKDYFLQKEETEQGDK